MSTTSEFAQLMDRVRTGCPEAARELFERYGKEIQLVVRKRLNRRLRTQFDSLDFTQDAWASFFDISPEKYTFRTPKELVGFLTRIACHKVIDEYRRRQRTVKHNRHEVHAFSQRTDGAGLVEPAARQPTPSQVAVAEEQWDQLLQDKPPQVRRALEMLRAGHSHREVAECLGVPTKLIQRLLQNLNPRRKFP
ncbi:MAG TPA: sigma-70 family RNA polymerase sigma factor [Gemmataceae bacterium]|jgi:RNA polymerase sigma-70 factor (ECF subfamily)